MSERATPIVDGKSKWVSRVGEREGENMVKDRGLKGVCCGSHIVTGKKGRKSITKNKEKERIKKIPKSDI
jgi:hypothetical protein